MVNRPTSNGGASAVPARQHNSNGQTPSRRPKKAHAVAASAISLTLLGGLSASVAAIILFEPACVADYSEDTIVAPDSTRGRLLCSVTNGELNDTVWPIAAIAVTAVAFAITATLLWARRRPIWSVTTTLAAAVAIPWLTVGAVAATPADCSPEQWDRYGASGCERSEELRPGLGQYWGAD